MLRIVRVGALDGNTVDVELCNGNILLLNMELLRSDPGFAALFNGDLLIHPKTDGASVYWRTGLRLTLGQILELIQKNNP